MIEQSLMGLRVLDLSQYLPGPFAARMLGDLGAQVIKVEPPQGDPLRHLDPEGKPGGTSPFYDLINAGKTVLTLDLKTAEDKARFAQLVALADVLLESFRPGVLDRLGFGPDRLKVINPRLIHCALSGFGQTGPLRLASGHDLGYVAMTGSLDGCGPADAPAIPFPPMADHAGAMQAVVAILGAVIARGRDGVGAFLDVSMMESLLLWQAPALTVPPTRGAGVIMGGAAFYNIYPAADGRFVSLSPLEAKFWGNFCRAVDRPDWIERQFEPLPQAALIRDVADLFASQPLAHWEALLADADCCYQAVLDCREVPDHPHIQDRGLVHRRERFVEVLLPVVCDRQVPAARPPVRAGTADAVLDAWLRS